MDEVIEAYKRRNKENVLASQRRRAEAARVFEACQLLANEFGFRLRRNKQAHYSLIKQGEWSLELYPGNQRIFQQKKQNRRAPFLDLPKPWGLMHVIHAANQKGTNNGKDKSSKRTD